MIYVVHKFVSFFDLNQSSADSSNGIAGIKNLKGQKKMDYLYHGSSGYYDILKPHQAYDTGFKEGCKKAVYATSNKNMALAFALGAVPNKDGKIERVMMPEYGDIMVFEKGTPNYGQKGYLYVLDKSKFQQTMGTQWVCFEEVEPVEVQEINVDDYLHLCLVKETFSSSYS